jgi:hypothetical protein
MEKRGRCGAHTYWENFVSQERRYVLRGKACVEYKEIAVKKLFLASVAALSMSVAIPAYVDAETISDQAIRAAEKKALVTLPPVEYDKPFAGKLEEVVVKSREEMDASCKRIGFSEPRVPLACGKLLAADHCVIYLARDEVYRSVGVTTELVRRHEVGHCNGWPRIIPEGDQ